MKITIITSNKPRHIYLINKFSKIAKTLNVIQENSTIFPGQNPGRNLQSKIMSNYFKKVNKSQDKFFSKHSFIRKSPNLNLLPLQLGDLNNTDLKYIKNQFLKSDYYIVFGSSFIKGKILKFLVRNKAINIHMGISPYFRGTDCNFWALHDGYGHLVGSTIHYLSPKIDGGKIIYHAISEKTENPFDYTMSTVKSAIDSLAIKVKDKKILDINPTKQDHKKIIRYSQKKNFTNKIVKNFIKKDFFKFEKKNYQNNLINPYILKKKEFFND